jgi:hypothetical protein
MAAHTEAKCLSCSPSYRTIHLLHKRYIICTVCNWTVLTVITQKPLLHVQLHNSISHLLYKYCTNCTVCNWTVLTVITSFKEIPMTANARHNFTALRNTRLCSCSATARRLSLLTHLPGCDDVIKESGVIGLTNGERRQTILDTVRMTQDSRSQGLSLPPIVQEAQT